MSLTTNIVTTFISKKIWLFLLVGCAIALFGRLGYLELSGEEPRRAVVAWEMLESNNFVVPHAYGMEYYNKPPAYHWLLAAFMKLFGPNEFVVRLPGILSFILLALTTFLWLRKETNDKNTFLAGLLVLFSADLFLYGSVFPGEIDLTFSLILLINGISIFKIGLQPAKFKWYLLAYVMLAFAVLLKGFMAFHFHFLALIAWLIYRKVILYFFRWQNIAALALAAVILFTYFNQYAQNGNATYLLLNNFIESGDKLPKLGLEAVLEQLVTCPWVLLKISLPWALVLPLLFKKKIRTLFNSYPIYLFSALYILSNIWIYWFFIDVRDRYLYPFVPYVCIIIFGILIKINWWPSRKNAILGLLFTMIALRLLFNYVVMPRQDNGQWSDNYIYRELNDTLLFHTNGALFNLYMSPDYEKLPTSMSGIDSIPKQPVIPYQIPYYLIKSTGHSPKNVIQPRTGNYYLVLDTDKKQAGRVLFEFTEPWYNKRVFLIRAN